MRVSGWSGIRLAFMQHLTQASFLNQKDPQPAYFNSSASQEYRPQGMPDIRSYLAPHARSTMFSGGGEFI